MTPPPLTTVESASLTRSQWLTVPNVLCVIRLVGSAGLVLVAFAGLPRWFLFGYLFLALTDWLDGRLAVWLKQQTLVGALLDSLADVVMYAVLLFGAVWLKGPVLLAEIWWIGAALATYASSIAVGLLKFGRLPSYHTLLAKISALLVLVATICLFTDWSIWPLRIASAVLMLANLEAIAVTSILRRWEANVWSLYHVLRKSP
ncbi:MAG: CDP-alcohol phosphatidyltransferase family protein [Planctomycetales bacterium]|nr:CDP-alcohol phosphatidyltransferase family protein [Planctomycetales bacterium]